MRLPALLKRFYRPKRLAITATVAVALLFTLSFAWLELTKYAKRRVGDEVAKLSKRLGTKVEIGRWRLGFGGALFDDIVVGSDAALVISRVAVDIVMNPFSDDLGKLESVVIQRVRLKQGAKALVESLRAASGAAGSGVDDAGTASGDFAEKARRGVERLFAALPTEKLLIKSGAITIIDDKGAPALTVRGVKLLIEKPASKALFQVGSVKTAGGLVDQALEGRFELMPKDGAYRFFLRKRVPLKGRAKGWSVAGRVRKDLGGAEVDFDIQALPAIFDGKIADAFGKSPVVSLKGRVKAERDLQGAYGFTATLASAGTRLLVPLVSSQPLGPVLLELTAKGRIEPDTRTVALEDATVDLPLGANRTAVRFRLKGDGRFPSAQLSDATVSGSVALEATECQTLLDAAPPGLLPALKDFKVSGDIQAALDFRFDGQNPEGLHYDLHDAKYGCRVKSMPPAYSPERLAGPFTIQRQVSKDDEPLEVSVSPMKPGYTPIAQISKNVAVAFTTSEDASFYVHKGIDTFAIDSALRRNLTEKRVAVGGSTITMQTAKNLFLNHERTISRKLQEVFLAWHLENVLDKERILEIYMNIVELGPGIYGVTQASEQFFGKHPYDLDLMESAYLAALLPNPKARYQYFCEGKMTPAFQDLVYGLMKRMVNLNRITYERYYQAMAAGLHFNDQNRGSARDCTRRTWATQPGALPSPKEAEATLETTGRLPRAED